MSVVVGPGVVVDTRRGVDPHNGVRWAAGPRRQFGRVFACSGGRRRAGVRRRGGRRSRLAATTERGSLTDWQARALGQARARNSPMAAQRRCLRGCGIGSETAARFRRRSFPPPGPASIGSRTQPSRFRPSPWSYPRKRAQRRSPPPSARERVNGALTTPTIRSPERAAPLAYPDRGLSAKSHPRLVVKDGESAARLRAGNTILRRVFIRSCGSAAGQAPATTPSVTQRPQTPAGWVARSP